MSDSPSTSDLKVTFKLSTHKSENDMTENNKAHTKLKKVKPRMIGARGGAALQELLSTAPNPDTAILDFQKTHGVDGVVEGENFGSAIQLLDLLSVRRSSVYESMLSALRQELLKRLPHFSQRELQKLLDATFPYIEFRELQQVPMTILSLQEETPEAYLKELTENRKILEALPTHVRRKILFVDAAELRVFVDECTREYAEERMAFYRSHPFQSEEASKQPTSSIETAASDLWNVSSHVPSKASSSTPLNRPLGWSISSEERRKSSAALRKLTDMIGDSEELYLSVLEIWKEYLISSVIPGFSYNNAKLQSQDLVDGVATLGALRADLANVQRDHATNLLRTDPIHKFIWFTDRAIKKSALDATELQELLSFVDKLRIGDLPFHRRLKKKPEEMQMEEEALEMVLGAPPSDQLDVLIEKLVRIDSKQIFAEPVPADVPKYHEVIQEPMDLSTMRKKARKHKYKSVEMLVDDFNLMIQNCLTFNPDTTVFYKEGKRVGKRGLDVIEKHAATLQGAPQKLRPKKRKKTGPGEAVGILSTSGEVVLHRPAVAVAGFVPEGVCEDQLADVAMVLSDPQAQRLISETLLKTLATCWTTQELPTDHLNCRGLVQLLQLGNAASLRRMVRKKEMHLKAPGAIPIRVALPLVMTWMHQDRLETFESQVWKDVLLSSASSRTLIKTFILKCLVENAFDVGGRMIQCLMEVETSMAQDRVFLHDVGEVLLGHVKRMQSTKLEDVVKTSVWKVIMDDFLLCLAEQEIEFKWDESGEEVVVYSQEAIFGKVGMLLWSVVEMKSGKEDVIETYLKQTIGHLRHTCASVDTFTKLWESDVWEASRVTFEKLLDKCPRYRDELFQEEEKPSDGDGAMEEDAKDTTAKDEAMTVEKTEEAAAEPEVTKEVVEDGKAMDVEEEDGKDVEDVKASE